MAVRASSLVEGDEVLLFIMPAQAGETEHSVCGGGGSENISWHKW